MEVNLKKAFKITLIIIQGMRKTKIVLKVRAMTIKGLSLIVNKLQRVMTVYLKENIEEEVNSL